MEHYILYKGEIEGRYKEVQIYPNLNTPDLYVIHWDGFEVGTIKKIEGKWHTKTVELLSVVNELGQYIDSQDEV